MLRHSAKHSFQQPRRLFSQPRHRCLRVSSSVQNPHAIQSLCHRRTLSAVAPPGTSCYWGRRTPVFRTPPPEYIVYSHAETAAHIGDIAIAIYRREQSKAIDYKALCRAHIIHRGLCISHTIAAYILLNTLYSLLINLVRCNYQFPTCVIVKIGA